MACGLQWLMMTMNLLIDFGSLNSKHPKKLTVGSEVCV
jgi:hypothetical protein